MPHLARHWSAVALLLCLGPARADTYYVVVFGAQSDPPRAKYSHSWATFVRFTPAGAGYGFTISWLPQAVELQVVTPFPEPGANFDLAASLKIVLSQGERVAAWGPYQIAPELYARALRHKVRLESGEVEYKTIDTVRDPAEVSNCIHALTVFNAENRRLRVGRTDFGFVASYLVTDSYRPWMVGPDRVHGGVAAALGLGRYPIRWRTLEEGRPRVRDE